MVGLVGCGIGLLNCWVFVEFSGVIIEGVLIDFVFFSMGEWYIVVI